MTVAWTFIIWSTILNKYKDDIEDFAWSSMPLHAHGVRSATVSGYSRYKTMPVEIIGVTPNVFEVLNKDFLDIDYTPSGLNLGEQLYTTRSIDGAGIGRNLANLANLNEKKSLVPEFLINVEYIKDIKFFKTKPTFILNSAPAYMMKSRRSFAKETVLVSIPNYLIYANFQGTGDVNKIKFRSLYIKTKESIDSQKLKNIKSDFDSYGFVFDIKELSAQMDEIINILDIIFTVIISLSMFL